MNTQTFGNSPSQYSVNQCVKTQLVEIPILTTNSALPQYKFPTQDFLRGKYIVSIETFMNSDIPFAPQSGFNVATPGQVALAFLTLYEQNPEAKDAQGIESSGEGQWNELKPLITLRRIQNPGGDPFVRELTILTPRVIVWEKSYVAIANGQSLANETPISFVFEVGYIGNAGDKN